MLVAMPGSCARTYMGSLRSLQGRGLLRSITTHAPELRSVRRHYSHSRIGSIDHRYLCAVSSLSQPPQMHFHGREHERRTTQCRFLQSQKASATPRRSFAAAAANTSSSANISEKSSSPSKAYIAVRSRSRTAAEPCINDRPNTHFGLLTLLAA